jgi:DUF1680 family protein
VRPSRHHAETFIYQALGHACVHMGALVRALQCQTERLWLVLSTHHAYLFGELP